MSFLEVFIYFDVFFFVFFMWLFIYIYIYIFFSSTVLVSQTLMRFLIMIVIDDEFIHYDISVSLYMFCELKIIFLLWINIVFSTHAFMVCFQYFRNLQVNSFNSCCLY